jgi:hypothetical protein
MSSEIKSGHIFLQGRCSKNLKNRFKKHCKELNVSEAQRIRDLAQQDIEEHKKAKKNGLVDKTKPEGAQ